jgi:hypothetical protein
MATRTKAPDTCRLSVTIRGTSYSVRPIRPEADDVVRAWRLRRANGTCYDVADTADGQVCDCADHVYRHEGNGTACKHVRALRALGLLDGEAGGPESWPTWTDHASFTVAR